MKVVVCNTTDEFTLPDEAFARYKLLSNNQNINLKDIPRYDKHLVQIVEEMSSTSNLKIVEVLDYIKWNIVRHNDGIEHVHEYHNAW